MVGLVQVVIAHEVDYNGKYYYARLGSTYNFWIVDLEIASWSGFWSSVCRSIRCTTTGANAKRVKGTDHPRQLRSAAQAGSLELCGNGKGDTNKARCEFWLVSFFWKLAFDGDFHVAAAFGISDVWDACFAADVDSKFEGDFPDFGACHILEGVQCVGGVSPDGLLDRLKGLGQLFGRMVKYDATSTLGIVFGWLVGDDYAGA